jgi:hypothetical protein
MTAINYNGLEILVVQTANPTGYKWTVQLDASRVRTGASCSRDEAIYDAKRFIDKATKAKPRTE